MKLDVRAPFDWNGLVTWLGARAIRGVEVVEDGVYARGDVRVSFDGAHVILSRADDEGSRNARSSHAEMLRSAQHDEVRPSHAEMLRSAQHDEGRASHAEMLRSAQHDEGGVSHAEMLRSAQHDEARVRRLFDLDADPARIHATLQHDPMLAPLLRKRPGVRVPGAWDAFELVVRAIVGQQVSVAAARTLLGRIAASHGFDPSVHAELLLDGMPRSRAETIQRAARATLASEPLTGVKGIGPWTANYIAMRSGDADAFPAGDLVLRRNAGNLSERELLGRAEAWRPFRAYAAMLLWQQ
jgi:3-methyladenine DNA glycosylase/8-oxoguanine DNA glycosylase